MGNPLLYVFIDESGLPSCGDCYAVAATWCESSRTDDIEVFSRTKDKCLQLIDSGASELKGSSLSPSELDTIVPSVKRFALNDGSVSDQHTARNDSMPFKHTLHTVQPTVIADTVDGGLNAPKRIKRHSLGTVLDPLFRPDRLNLPVFSEIRIVLDAETWERARRQFETTVNDRFEDYSTDVSFTVADSVSVPGIQISDLAAYVWARNRREGDCKTAARTVDDRRFGVF